MASVPNMIEGDFQKTFNPAPHLLPGHFTDTEKQVDLLIWNLRKQKQKLIHLFDSALEAGCTIFKADEADKKFH